VCLIDYLKHSIWDLCFVRHVAALALPSHWIGVTVELAHYACGAPAF